VKVRLTLPLASLVAPAVTVAVVPPTLTVRAEPAAKPEPEIVTEDPALPLVGLGAPTEDRTVTEPLDALVAVHELRTAVTLYKYEPGAKPVSSQAVGVAGSSEVGELAQAGLAVAPTNRCT
jgi:hypothetical protein